MHLQTAAQEAITVRYLGTVRMGRGVLSSGEGVWVPGWRQNLRTDPSDPTSKLLKGNEGQGVRGTERLTVIWGSDELICMELGFYRNLEEEIGERITRSRCPIPC